MQNTHADDLTNHKFHNLDPGSRIHVGWSKVDFGMLDHLAKFVATFEQQMETAKEEMRAQAGAAPKKASRTETNRRKTRW